MILRNLYIFFLLLPIILATKPGSIVDIIRSDDRFTVLVDHLERTGLIKEIKDLKSATLFAPVNEAFEKREENETTYLLMGQKVTHAQLLYHVLPVTIESNDFYDGQLLTTMNSDQKLKVHIDKGLYIGDAEVIERDLEAASGAVVQVINQVLTTPVRLDDTLARNEDTKEFGSLAHKSGIDSLLNGASAFTVFATQHVLDGLSEAEKAYLNHSSAKDDLGSILKHQIYDGVLYTHDLPTGETKYKSLQGEQLTVYVSQDGDITVNDVRVTRSDILASNGVIHLLEKPILPRQKDFLNFDVRKALIGMNATKFISLFYENGLGDYLENANNSPFTILAPPNEALNENTVPKNQLKSWLRYHIVQDKYNEGDLVDNALLKTESQDHLGRHFQRVRVHVTDQDAVMTGQDIHATKQSIQFGRAGLVGNPVSIKSSIIYPMSRALLLPMSPLRRLPVNLDLSTFVATLYASGSADEIESAEGITLFAPTNQAFARLGLLTKHLLQPESKQKLDKVIKYHAIQNIYYANSTTEGEHREPTLAGPEISLNKTKDGILLRGAGAADGNDRSVIAQVTESDILVNNGVVHKIDRVQLPSNVDVTNRDLLSAETTTSILGLLERTHLGEVLDELKGSYTILAPSDRAFAKLNFTRLLEDPDKLLRLVKLHILPTSLPLLEVVHEANSQIADNNEDRKVHKEITKEGVEFKTLLDDTKVLLRRVDSGYSVHVQGSNQDVSGVIDVGRASNGGGVIEIDSVLLPAEELGRRGLAWWAVLLIVLAVIFGIAVIGFAGYYGYRWWQQRRQGYISLEQ
ncbi:hypothetical protein DFQ28_002788 [Apophysomyces sp. BC1034]|nr:hypothetical protein DFQ30_003132 [Apophysomyces sp. BC1015]KAG0179483.1 hypothetical protein DFQ29_002068 [Apophysomyces sp. BC1021]KAG0189871.1 hypothetical protein DFQ28_002788 [Apophysomyces sp. BC1034]